MITLSPAAVKAVIWPCNTTGARQAVMHAASQSLKEFLRCHSTSCHCCLRFDAINGLLVPGGAGNLTAGHPFYDNTEYLLQLAIEANDQGDYFPVRHCSTLPVTVPVHLSGTCLATAHARSGCVPLL